VPVSPVFAGTGLEGARLTGRLAGLIDTYGAQLLEIYRSNERFYADARTSLDEAWDTRAVADARLAAAESRVHAVTPVVPSPAGSAPESSSPESPSTESSTSESSREPSGLPTIPERLAPTAPSASAEPATPEEDRVSFLVVSDLHCNMNMTPLIRDIAERAGVSAILDAGDTTMNGTAVEKVCVDSFATARPQGVPMVVSDGNHDSVLVADAQRSAGLTVLEGSVVDVAGVHILGDRDPNETRVGAGTSSRGESASEVGRRLAETACDDDVDLLLIHTPSVGDASMWSGCVPFQVSGHTHTRYDPVVRGYGVRYVNGSTAGAASGQPTVGPLHGTAQMTVLRFDPSLRRFVDWKLVEVFPDTTASVSGWQPIPVPPVKPAPEDSEPGDDAQPRGTQSDDSQADEPQSTESPSTESPSTEDPEQ
jgi:predicted phosphodiesterase